MVRKHTRSSKKSKRTLTTEERSFARAARRLYGVKKDFRVYFIPPALHAGDIQACWLMGEVKHVLEATFIGTAAKIAYGHGKEDEMWADWPSTMISRNSAKDIFEKAFKGLIGA